MDVEMIKFVHATRDLIYATLALNSLVTIYVVIQLGLLIRRLFTAARDGDQAEDFLRHGTFKATQAEVDAQAQLRARGAVQEVIQAIDVRHLAQMSEYRYQRKKMNSLLMIMRRIHDFMIFGLKPTKGLASLDELEEEENDETPRKG